MSEAIMVPLDQYQRYTEEQMLERARAFYQEIRCRRTVRDFSDQSVPEQVIRDCLAAAASAPSGANMQPWHFVVVRDASVKRRIREAAEQEEQEFYTHRASPEWLEALRPLGTDANKAFLERAPILIAIFAQKFGLLPDGRKVKHYYPAESTGLATGILITALHVAGLATLTHTPSPMKFLNEILNRPKSERPFLLLVVGYPAANARVPDIKRKSLSEFCSFIKE